MPRDFNGTTDRIDYASAFTTSGQALSVAMWINPDGIVPGANNRFLFSSAISGGSNGTVFGQAAGYTGALIFLRVRATTNRQAISASNAISASTWQHVVMTDTGTLASGQTAFYVNGVVVATFNIDTAGSGAETAADQGVSLGGRISADDRMFDGQMGHVAVYNRVLTAGEADALARGCPPTLLPGLRFYGRLDGGDWKNILDASGTLDGTTATQAPNTFTYRPQLAHLGLGASAPTISSTSDTNTLIDQSTFVITGTNLAAATAVTIKQTNRPNYNATANISGNTAASITLTGLDVQAMGIAYGTAAGVGTTVSVTTANGQSADFGIDVDPQAAHQYITLAGHTPGAGWALEVASANGDQLVAPVTTAKGGTFAFVGATGAYTITYPGAAPVNDSAYWAWFDDSADVWSTRTVRINPAAVEDVPYAGTRGITSAMTSNITHGMTG
jgi:hypothetical protein